MKTLPVTSLSPLIEKSHAALAAYSESPDRPELFANLCAVRRETARAIGAGGRQGGASDLRAIAELQRKLSASGAYDPAATAEDLVLANEFVGKGPVGLLAAMLLVPGWQWPDVPGYAMVPPSLWTLYTGYAFYSPQGFCEVGHAESYATHYLQRLEELACHVADNPSAEHVRAALNAYAAINRCIPLYFSTGSLRRHMELRGRLLTAQAAIADQPVINAKPRMGRRLRVGFVNRHFGSQTETYTTLPTFEKLDPARFEVQLFAHHFGDSELEKHVRGSVEKFTVLPADLAAQLVELRAAELDVVVFGTNVTAVCHEVTRLALHRIAPLQVVNNSSCTTTGFPEIDLYVSGTATESPEAAAHFTERLALVEGPAHAFNYTIDHQAPTTTWTRKGLGIPEEAVLFVSAANFYKIIPEVRESWAKLLAAVPGSRLLVHPFNPNWSSHYPIKRFCAEFDEVLAAYGVAADRLIVSSTRFPSRSDVAELLKLGDLYLDTFPFAGVNSLIDPLQHGVPVVTQEGATFRSRMGAALLRSLGLDELIATTESGCHDLCVKLATDAAARARLRGRIVEAMEQLPLFLDTLAASDGFGCLLEKAYDQLAEQGHAAFRRNPATLLAGDVASVAHRRTEGDRLLANGNASRAVDYLLSAIQHNPHGAGLWCSVATALYRSQRTDEAVQALQTCLQLDERLLAGWRLLKEISEAVGHADLLGEANTTIARLTAPSNNQPHVVLYTDDPGLGGVAQYNHSVMTGLIAAGYRVTCVQSESDGPLVQQQRDLGIAHRWIPYDTKREFARTVEDQASARVILGETKPDLVLFSDCCPLSNLGAREFARHAGIPYVVVVGFVGAYLADRFKPVLGRLAAQYAAARAVVAVSQENLDLLRNRFGLPAQMGQVIHYGRPEKFFAPRDESLRSRLRAELDLPSDAVVCFTAARLDPVKGYLYQVLAAKHLVALSGTEKLHFVWAGEGEQRGAIEHAIAAAGLSNRIHLLGHRWDVSDWYDAADLFVLPSDLEGMPLAIMEAMAKGLPVVATAVSGIPEELGTTGHLLPAATKDRAGLVNQLIRTLHLWNADAALRHSLGEAARLRAHALFRESLMLERTVGLVRTHLAPVTPAAVSA